MSDPTTSLDDLRPIEQISADFSEHFVRANIKTTMKSHGATPRDVYMVPIDAVHVYEGFNVRVPGPALDAHIRWIADSILANGYYPEEPLGGFVALDKLGEPRIYVHKGHCRLAGAKLARSEGADLQALPLITVPKETALEDIVVELATTNSGKPLTPYELAIVCKRLSGYGWTSSTIAKRLGRSSTYVDGLLGIMGAPLAIREMIQEGTLTVATAQQALSRYGVNAVSKLTAAIQTAKTHGKEHVSAKHLPGRRFENLVKRTGPKLYEAARTVREDPGFSALSSVTQNLLDQLIAELAEKERSLATTAVPGDDEESNA